MMPRAPRQDREQHAIATLMAAASPGVIRLGPRAVPLSESGEGEGRTDAMEGGGKFEKPIQFWHDVEHARGDIYSARKDCELIARLWEKDRQELEQTVLDLCYMCCPKRGCKLGEIRSQNIRVDRCTGCGGVWLAPWEAKTLAPRTHMSWLGELRHRMTNRGEESGWL